MDNKEIFAQISDIIKQHNVVIFMKGTAAAPMCGFSQVVVQIFKNLGVTFKDVNVLDSAELRQGIKEYTNWPTIPQVYVKQEFIGGCDIVKEMYQSKELLEILQKHEMINT